VLAEAYAPEPKAAKKIGVTVAVRDHLLDFKITTLEAIFFAGRKAPEGGPPCPVIQKNVESMPAIARGSRLHLPLQK
jgi:hypothetical protein